LPVGMSPRSSVSISVSQSGTPRTPLSRCCQSHEKTGSSARACQSYEKTGSSARALSSPPSNLSYDVSIAAVAAASARTAALLGAGPEQTASAVEEAVESFFRTIRKQEPKPSRTLYFDLYRDDEEEDHDDELTCEPPDPSVASDRTTPTGTSRPSEHASYGGSSSGGDGMLHTPLAYMASSQLSPHSGGSAARSFSAGTVLRNPWCGEQETSAESTAGMCWDAHSLLSGYGGSPPPAPAWAAASCGGGFHADGPPRATLQGPPLALPPRPRSRPAPQGYGKLPRSRGVRASQLLDGALTSAFVL